MQASVDVATGNLLVNTVGLSLPGVNSTIPIGVAYNSLGSQTGATTSSSATNWTWGFASAGSLSLVGANVVYTGADGVTWTFTPVSGSATAFTSPAGFKQDLAKTTTGSYTLTDRESRQVVSFDVDGKATSVADRNGNATQITYSANGQPASVISTAGPTPARTAALAYNPSTLVFTVSQTGDSYNTRTVKYQKDSASNLVSIVDAAGNTTSLTYKGTDLTSITSVTGAKTTFTYDGTSHKVTKIDQENTTAGSPGTSTTRLAYASTTQTLVAGANTDTAAAVSAVPRTTYTINPTQKLVTKAVDAAGRERSSTFTGNADVESSTTGQAGAATSGTTTGTYGANGGNSLTKATSPGGASSSTTYGSTPATAYLPASSTDDAGNKSVKTFNGAGNALSNADASGATATLTYNTDGTVATATAPGNGANKTTYTYNANKQLTGMTPVTGSSLGAKAFTYDTYGRLASQTDGRGNTSYNGYDKLDRVVEIRNTDDALRVNNIYDKAGRLTASRSASGTIDNTYDQLGRQLTTKNSADGVTVSYTYDKAGNQLTQTDSFGTYTNAFDASNVLTSTTYPKGDKTAQIQYETDANGRRTGTWLQSNAAHTVWAGKEATTYDASGRVATLKAWTGSGDASNTAVFDTTYCYNASSPAPTCGTAVTGDRAKLQWSKDNITGQTTSYTYDSAGRVTKVAQAGGTGANTSTYTYDARGNRLTAVTTGAAPSSQTLTYNAANQITTAGYSYDGAGNMTANPTTAFTYNAAQQMTKAVKGSVTSTYTYAGIEQKAVLSQSVSSGVSYKTTYGKADQNGNPTIATYTGNTSSSHVYSDPITGQALMLTTSSDIATLYIWDGIGNPVGLLTDFSTNAFSYTYDPYGTRTLAAGGTGNGAGQNPYSFKSGIQDRASGLVKFGLRWYDATSGTWTQQDTLDAPLDPSNANRYGYAAGDPVNFADFTGAAVDFGKASRSGLIGAGVGAATGCIGGLAAGGVGCAPGALGGAVAGLVGGFATSVAEQAFN
ncbi:hypothetical protein IFT72_14990 [Frigoribacterium sp. CFBP 8754]|uniref:RHS repeat domain-containing protein n=1 Tax=Frigoribacterium sp. CFBP 8754 TaxID=2775290 RepID=UPI00177BB770|nr:hypothetical protein [Frigoribacterium sp. CFBP 8754]